MLKLYPTNEKVQTPFYKIYNHKTGETIIVTETENGNEPILIGDSIWFEKIPATANLLAETWASIENSSKQGLLKRAYTLDFEKHLPDSKVEIYIAVSPHC